MEHPTSKWWYLPHWLSVCGDTMHEWQEYDTPCTARPRESYGHDTTTRHNDYTGASIRDCVDRWNESY